MRTYLLLALSCCFTFLLVAKLPAQETRPTPKEAPIVEELQKLGVKISWDQRKSGWSLSIRLIEDLQPVFELIDKLSPQDISELLFSRVSVDDAFMESVGRFHKLTTLSLIDTKCTSASLAEIGKLSALTQLGLQNTFTNEGLENLQLLKNLETLSIRECEIDDEGMKAVGKLKNLKSLTIQEIKITDVGLSHLAGLTELTYLKVCNKECTDAGISHLKEMQLLELLTLIGENYSDVAIDPILTLPKLRDIRIEQSQVTSAGVDRLVKQFPKAMVRVSGPGFRMKRPQQVFPPGFTPPKRIARLPATIEVANATPIRVAEDDAAWKHRPTLTENGTFYQPNENAGPVLKFTVKKGGYVVLAVSWKDEGELTAEQRQQRKSLGQLQREGWKLEAHRDRKQADGSLDRHFLLYREFKEGEKYEVLARPKTAPFIFVPTQRGLSSIDRYPAITATIETLEKLPPRFPQAGLANFDTLMVTSQIDPTPALPLDNGLLLAELARQAIQITARHEFSLATLDTSSGLKLPQEANPVNRPLEVVSTTLPRSVEITVLRAKDQKLHVEWKHWYSMEGPERYELLATQMEQESRTSLIEELRAIGFSGEPYRRLESGEPSAEALKLLTQMNCIAQFAAIQYLHEQIQLAGESPERLSALSRAYANISLLTEFHFRPLKTVWRARAALYAERLHALYPKSALGVPTKAYAWALIGRHHTALSLLDDKPLADLNLPSWALPVAAFCRFDQKVLEKLADDPESGELTRLLLLVSTLGYRDESFLLDAADRVLEKTPDSYYAINEIGSYGQLGTNRRGIGLVAVSYLKHLPRRLEQLPHLPEKMNESFQILEKFLKLPRHGRIPEMAPTEIALSYISDLKESALNDKDKFASGTPGNDLLAAMLEDMVFVHLWRELSAKKYSFGVPVDEELQTNWPKFKEYPLAVILWCMASDERLVEDARKKALEQLHPADATIKWSSFGGLLKYSENPGFNNIVNTYRRHSDAILDETRGGEGSYAVRPRENYIPSFARDLKLIAPNMPATIAWWVETDPAFTVEQGKAFALKYKNSAPVLYALADRFTHEKQYEFAELCWKRYIRLVPSANSWESLADLYLKQRDIDRWLETMKQALEEPSLGLEHTFINVRIAKYLMEEKDFRQALPYSLAAASSYASGGLISAAKCYEGLQDWTLAEKYYRADVERYPDFGVGWYLFCRRTGQGNLAAAYQAAFDYVGRVERGEAEIWYRTVGTLYRLENQPEKALAVYQKLVEKEPDPFGWLQLATTADILGNQELRLSALQKVVEIEPEYTKKNPRDKQTDLAELAKFLLTVSKMPDTKEKPAGIDRETLKNLLDEFHWYGLEANYVIGQYYFQRDQEELAIEHWMKCMESSAMNVGARTLAGAEIIKLAITPEDYREALQTPPPKKKPSKETSKEEAKEAATP